MRILNRSWRGRTLLHDLKNAGLGLRDLERPLLKIVLGAERAVGHTADALHSFGDVDHFQSVLMVAGRHGGIVPPPGLELIRLRARMLSGPCSLQPGVTRLHVNILFSMPFGVA
jgi:hypothetical protein